MKAIIIFSKNKPIAEFLQLLVLICAMTFSVTSRAQQLSLATPSTGNSIYCNVNSCFINQAAADKFAKDNNCILNKCTFSAKRVAEELAKIPKSDPTYGFYRNQECIAKASCDDKAKLDSSKWLDNVVFDFIAPLVNESGNWKAVKAQCQTYMIAPGLQCQNDMAEYHIQADLQASLNKNGCGTQKDWDKIGDQLKTCVELGIKDDGIILPGTASWIASFLVKSERDKVRAKCITFRTGAGLPIEE